MQSYTNELADKAQAGLLRGLRQLPTGTLDMASNDYLNLSQHPAVLEAGISALGQWGAGGRASRLVSGNLPPHQQLESTIAKFKHTEASLVFPSGYHANLSVLTALTASGDFLFCDKRNHASLIDACHLAAAQKTVVRYFGNVEKLQHLLQNAYSQHPQKRRFIVSDGVFSMDGDVAKLPELLSLARKFDATVLLDDAHGTGTLGAAGHGTIEHFHISSNEHIIQIGTLSKAIGGQGGFVAASQNIIDWIINRARPFIYTTALNPASAAMANKAFEIMEQHPKMADQLRATTHQLRVGLSNLGFDVIDNPSPIVPIIIGSAKKTLNYSNQLLENGVWCPAIRPPTVPAGKSRLRLTANLSLSEADVSKVLFAFKQLIK